MKSQETDSDASDFSGDSNLSSQIVISRLIDKNGKSWGGLRKTPYAFTENGVAMLSSVLIFKGRKRIPVKRSLVVKPEFFSMFKRAYER